MAKKKCGVVKKEKKESMKKPKSGKYLKEGAVISTNGR